MASSVTIDLGAIAALQSFNADLRAQSITGQAAQSIVLLSRS